MSSYTYTWTLTDIGLGALTEWMPVVTVRPAVSAFGPDGLVSDVRVPVTATGGVYSATLIPSAELTPEGGGSAGVDYVIEVGRFELADDLTKIWRGTEAWRFTALPGGGNVGTMAPGIDVAVYSAYVNLNAPPAGYRGWWLYSPAEGQEMPLDDPLIGELRMVA